MKIRVHNYKTGGPFYPWWHRFASSSTRGNLIFRFGRFNVWLIRECKHPIKFIMIKQYEFVVDSQTGFKRKHYCKPYLECSKCESRVQNVLDK